MRDEAPLRGFCDLVNEVFDHIYYVKYGVGKPDENQVPSDFDKRADYDSDIFTY